MASGSGWNLWVWLLGVVVRRYIDFLILLIPLLLYLFFFCSSIPTFCSFKKNFFVLVRSTDVARRGYYLFQLYRNTATIRGWLLFEVQTVAATIYFSSTAMRRLFEVQTSQLLFISALPQCGDYSRAATIQSTDVAATIYFSATAMQRLFEVQTSWLLFISALPQCGDYSKAATIYFSFIAMRRLFEGGYYSKYRRRGYYLFQRYRNAATIRGRLLFKVQTSRLLFISALPQCSDYSRAATIRSTDVAATIYFSTTTMRKLFEGGYYLKYRHRGYYIFQSYRNVATIRRRLLFEGGVYSRKYSNCV